MTASARIGRANYKTEITLGTHTLYADELKDHGGQDEGPEPPEYLNVALASCTAITLRMYADRKNIPLEGVRVDVE
ncbi:MAG: osmotically inducible protein C, partial [Cytophaga sp.]|nr:osmotically inducible protein C [Cytophaga sp.]